MMNYIVVTSSHLQLIKTKVTEHLTKSSAHLLLHNTPLMEQRILNECVVAFPVCCWWRLAVGILTVCAQH